MIRIVIPGVPISKARHRLTRVKGKTLMYDPQNAEKQRLKNYIKCHMLRLGHLIHSRNTQYKIKFKFYFPLPNNLTHRERSLYLWGHRNHHIVKDNDNMEKFYCDVGNKILYHDDRQIVTLESEKCYDLNPRTVIELTPYDELKNERLEEILSIYSPLDIEDLITKCETIKNFYNMQTSDEEGVPSIMQQENIAYQLQDLATKHADKLRKIEKLK